MKLSTRLAVVVTVILTIVSLSIGTFSIYINKSTQVDALDLILKNAVSELSLSEEDIFANSLVIAEKSAIPLTLIYLTRSDSLSYLSEGAGSLNEKPSLNQIANGKKRAIQISQFRSRFIQVSQGETLGILISTKTIDNSTSRAWRSILLFDVVAIILGALITFLLFRRDSKINASARAMQEFIGDASHELKTPLTVIRGYSEILMKEHEYAKRIHDESLRMSKIIDDLLLIASLDEGDHAHRSEVTIETILQKEIHDLLVLQPGRKVESGLRPLSIFAEEKIIISIFSNIFANIRAHTPDTAPVRVTIADNEVVVEDGGPGLKEIPTKPFERFDQSRSRETGGSGLGMSIIQKSIVYVGGKVSFGRSELGGLKVTIRFTK